MKWAIQNGKRILASPGATGCCPGCHHELRPKCGEIKTWHWAHLGGDCDPWHESETPWHLNWKRLFPDSWQEVVIGPHRADIKTPRMVIELQHSSISPAEIRERESFYGDMIWIFDLRPRAQSFSFLSAGSFMSAYLRRPVIPTNAVAWTRARRTIFACQKPVLVHLGRNRLYNIFGFGLYPSLNFQGGFYRQFSEEEFMHAVGARNQTPATTPPFQPLSHVPHNEIREERLAYFWDERDPGHFSVHAAQSGTSQGEPKVLHRFSRHADITINPR